VDHMEDVRIEAREVFPMSAMAAPAMAPVAPPVQVTASAQPITSTVAAELDFGFAGQAPNEALDAAAGAVGEG